MLNHQDKNMMKAQVHVSKSSAISNEQALPLRKLYCQIYQVVKHMLRGRLLTSFQDHEHEGGDTRSQGDIKDNDVKIKIQDHSMQKKFPRTRLQVSRKVVKIVLWYLDSGCSKHMTGDRSQLTNFINKNFSGVKFGYIDYQIGNVMISRVYYVEGLGHWAIIDMMASSPICLLSKALKSNSWLWHRRLSHLNFGAINHLARHGLVRGCDQLALVDSFTPVNDNIGLLETRFNEEGIFVFVFPEDVTGSVNLTLLSFFFGVAATNYHLNY
nr:hypothetical protein [Tanacetum cinerariifolium]